MMGFLAPIFGFLAVVGPAVVIRMMIRGGANRSQLVGGGVILTIVMVFGIVLSMGYSTAGAMGVLIGCGVLIAVLAGAIVDASRGSVGQPLSDSEAERILSDNSLPPRHR